MALVPEHLPSLRTIPAAFDEDLLGLNQSFCSLAEDYCDFLPRYDFRGSFRRMSNEERKRICERVNRVVEHIHQHSVEHCGEFAWEVDVWSDIFGKIRDDIRLRMSVMDALCIRSPFLKLSPGLID
jgi:hypothetical protein